MAGNPLATLKRRRKDILGQIKALQKELDSIDEVVNKAEELADHLSSRPTAVSGGNTGGAKPAEVVSAAETILGEAKIPMTRGQLLKALSERSVVIGGTNPANTLGTTLSRNKEVFVNIEGYGYWLKRREFSPGRHFPNQQAESVREGVEMPMPAGPLN